LAKDKRAIIAGRHQIRDFLTSLCGGAAQFVPLIGHRYGRHVEEEPVGGLGCLYFVLAPNQFRQHES
jgi:hypothetical protein